MVVGVYEGGSSVEALPVSTEGQCAAITIVPDVAASGPDGHPLAPMSTSVTTLVVATGVAIGSTDGFAVKR